MVSSEKNDSDNMSEKVLHHYSKSKFKNVARDPLELLVYFVLCDGLDSSKHADKAMDRLKMEFINWNDLRVARRTEIARVLDPIKGSDDKSQEIKEMLASLFDVCGSMSMDRFNHLKVSEGRKALGDIYPELARSVASIILYSLVPGCTIPITAEGMKAARKHNLVKRGGTKTGLQKLFLSELEPYDAGLLVQFLEAEGAGQVVAMAEKRVVKKKKKKVDNPEEIKNMHDAARQKSNAARNKAKK